MNKVIYSRQSEIAIATVESPPVNALSLDVRKGLMDAIARAVADPEIKALIIMGGGRTFVAGADISEFGKPYIEPTLYAINDALGASPKPVIAAIHGTALGGGLDLALSCQWRVAVPTAKVGQPEVKLGLMPGAGGTQWWPRLAGPKNALEIATSGNPVGAERAKGMGVIDEIVDGDLLTGALAFARQVVASGQHNRHLAGLTEKTSNVDPEIFAAFRKKNERKWRGLLAPWKIVDCIEAACQLSFQEAAEREKAAFQECARSPQSEAQIHLFLPSERPQRLSTCQCTFAWRQSTQRSSSARERWAVASPCLLPVQAFRSHWSMCPKTLCCADSVPSKRTTRCRSAGAARRNKPLIADLS